MKSGTMRASVSRARIAGFLLRAFPLLVLTALVAAGPLYHAISAWGGAAEDPAASSTAGTTTLVYVANNGGGNISSYSVDQSTGILLPAAGVASGKTPIDVTTLSAGGTTFVYATANGDNAVWVYSLDPTNGVLTPKPSSTSFPNPITVGAGPMGITSANGGAYVYVANNGDNTISAFVANSDGTLSPAKTAVQATSGPPVELASASIAGTNYLYVTESTNQVEVFSINTMSPDQGVLTPVGSPTSVGNAPNGIVINATGSFLYVANTADSNISEFTINPANGELISNGVLNLPAKPERLAVDGSTHVYVTRDDNMLELCTLDPSNGGSLSQTASYATGGKPMGVVSVGGSHVYVANSGDDTVSQFSEDATGVLTPLAPPTVPAGKAPLGITVEGNHLYVFAADSAGASLTSFAIGASGTLSPVALTAAGNGVTGVAADQKGTVLFATNHGDNTISCYVIDQNSGAPRPNGPAVSTGVGSGPKAAVVNPAGSFLFVVNNGANTVATWTIQGNGAIGAHSSSSFATGNGPSAIALDAAGANAYVTNEVDGNVSEFAIAGDGSLSPVGTAAAGKLPTGIAVTPGGSFAYVINSGDNTVEPYSRSGNGSLTPESQLDKPTGKGPSGIAITPDGRFLYVVNNGDNTVSGFTINSDGSLTPDGPARSTGTSPSQVGIDPTGTYLYVTNNSTDKTVSIFKINGDGSLTSVSTAAAGLLPLGIVLTGVPGPPPSPTKTPKGRHTPTALKVAPPALRFPNEQVGDSGNTSRDKKVNLSNPRRKSGTAINFTTSVLNGDYAIDSGASTCNGSLNPGQRCAYELKFIPSNVGQDPGDLVITDNVDPHPIDVKLNGRGVAALLTISPRSLNFPPTAVGTPCCNPPKTVTLTNNNSVPVTVTGTSASGDFVAQSNCSGALTKGQSCQVQVTFTPTQAGKRTGILEIDSGKAGVQKVKLSGKGK